MHKNPIYDPREDSYLLADVVRAYAKGETLDVGTGSGIQAFAAASRKEVTGVLAVDINTDALEHAKKWNHHPLITFIQSDLFSDVKGKFDTIIFNPPYLPDDPNVRDIALDGGEKGYELSVRFLKAARDHLNDDGQILFLFSSLTQKNVIEDTLIENAYTFEEIAKQDLHFEKLYVYKIRKVECIVPDVKDITFFTKGKRGMIYTAKYKDKKVGIKILNPKSEAIGRVYIEGKNLQEVNKLGIGPKIVKGTEEYMMYEFVEGILFPEFIEKANKKDIIEIIFQVFRQMHTLDLAKINKEEMTNPYKHIIITEEKKAVLIDFERSNKDLRPHNMTQFCQYLISDKLSKTLKDKGFRIDHDELIKLAQKYKNNYYDAKDYNNILEAIR